MATVKRKRKLTKRMKRLQAPRHRAFGDVVPALRRYVLPISLTFSLLVCLAALGFVGFRTVTASSFFNVAAIDVRGVERASGDDIRRIVAGQTEKSGAWNADLEEIRARIERLPFVKSVAVSRVLPNRIRISVVERLPAAIVRLATGNVIVDQEANTLAPATSAEPDLPFVILGWNESKSEKAAKENIERVKVYRRMLDDWQQFDLASRVKFVILDDLREPRAMIEDSGQTVSIALAKDDLAGHLKRGINAIVGKGDTFEAVNLVGQNMILAPRRTSALAK